MIGNPKQPKKKKKSTSIPKAIVKAVFERDNGICQYCGKLTDALDKTAYFLPAGQVHHIIKRRKIKGHQVEYLNTCCFECHYSHSEISQTDKLWLAGEDVYIGGRLNDLHKNK